MSKSSSSSPRAPTRSSVSVGSLGAFFAVAPSPAPIMFTSSTLGAFGPSHRDTISLRSPSFFAFGSGASGSGSPSSSSRSAPMPASATSRRYVPRRSLPARAKCLCVYARSAAAMSLAPGTRESSSSDRSLSRAARHRCAASQCRALAFHSRIAERNRRSASPLTAPARWSSAGWPCAGSASMPSIARRSAPGWLSLSANRAALAYCPEAAAFDNACVTPAFAARSFASSSSAAAVASSHSVSFASAPPVASLSPSPCAASAQALSSCASSVATAAPDRTPHRIKSPSPPTLAICVPEVRNLSPSTAPVCASSVRRHELPTAPAFGSTDQSLIVLSPPAVAMTRSVGENSTAHTPRLCPRSAPAGMRSGSFHNRAVRSPEHVAPSPRFGAIVAQFTALSCAIVADFAPSATGVSSPSAAASRAARTAPAMSHNLATLSAPPERAIGAPPRRASATAATAPTCPSPTARHRAPAFVAAPLCPPPSSAPSPRETTSAAGVRSHSRTV